MLALAVCGPVAGAECGESNEIVYNAMQLLAGSGDTIAVASYDQKGWAVNLTTTQGREWWGYSFECYNDKLLFDMAFGNRTLAVLFNPADYETYRAKPGTVWWYSYRDRRTRTREIKWHDSVFTSDTLVKVFTVDMVAAAGSFFIACQDGGMLRWDPANDRVRGYLPGESGSFDPTTFSPGQHPSFGSRNEQGRVVALDRLVSGDSTRLVVVTPQRLWLWHVVDSSWDSSITNTLADSALAFREFVSAAVNNSVSPPIIYAYIKTGQGSDSAISLFRYRHAAGNWLRRLKDGPAVIAPASRGYMYCVKEPNIIELYRDSIGDTADMRPDGLSPVITNTEMYRRLTVNRGIAQPDDLNDMLYVPVTDSSGRFCIAASSSRPGSDGLYLSPAEEPGTSTNDFDLHRRDRVIKAGLKETYALPGIICDNYSIDGAGSTTFIYKLEKDARVTIRIYDYNMRHVKTIIENAPRRAATPSGRSTDTRYDIWDGTTASGRTVAPGVYYYKITANSGERSFGKIVVAK
ncbi:MAG: hypothetical protein JW768_00415 [Chitinispirillaceae bacterium]|nr:hypothetical protein [Chitinispirillaceae bacterium]